MLWAMDPKLVRLSRKVTVLIPGVIPLVFLYFICIILCHLIISEFTVTDQLCKSQRSMSQPIIFTTITTIKRTVTFVSVNQRVCRRTEFDAITECGESQAGETVW